MFFFSDKNVLFLECANLLMNFLPVIYYEYKIFLDITYSFSENFVSRHHV